MNNIFKYRTFHTLANVIDGSFSCLFFSLQQQRRTCEMQPFDAGLANADVLSCKENLPASIKPKRHAHHCQLYRPIPSASAMVATEQLQENIPPSSVTCKHARPTRKPAGQLSRALACSVQPSHTSSHSASLPPSPFPELSWTDSDSLWHCMRAKDTCMAAPETDLLVRHPSILPNMRTILLDWMLEVSI